MRNTIPVITSADDLPDAIRAAADDPEIRWYVVKKARSFHQEDLLPSDWGEPVMASGITAANREFSKETREKYAEDGIALPDGSFPIPDKDALRRAIASVGRADDYDRARRHIIKRAKALNAVDMLPDDWGVTASADLESRMLELRMRALLSD